MTAGLKVLLALIAVVLLVLGFSYAGRTSDWTNEIANCHTLSVPGSQDAVDRDRDLIDFARAAADARRKDGQYAKAAEYDAVADRADLRRVRTQKRADIPCEKRFPRPTLLP